MADSLGERKAAGHFSRSDARLLAAYLAAHSAAYSDAPCLARHSAAGSAARSGAPRGVHSAERSAAGWAAHSAAYWAVHSGSDEPKVAGHFSRLDARSGAHSVDSAAHWAARC